MKRNNGKNKLVKVGALLCATICFACCFAGCTDEKENTDLLPPINQATYLLGGCELTEETRADAEPGATGHWVAQTAKVLGVKTQRVWMHITDILVRDEYSDTLSLKEDVAENYHAYLKELQDAGVERIVAMNHMFYYPYGYDNLRGHPMVALNPFADADFYGRWIQMYYEAYVLMATEFPEIGFWEPGNEWDFATFFQDNGIINDTPLALEVAGTVSADLIYAANKAVKTVNPKNAVVYPGLSHGPNKEDFLENCYAAIESKTLPTLEDYYIDDPDAYFDILAVHPYADGKPDEFKEICENIHAIASDHGDAEKRLWLTEMGITESWKSGTESEKQTAAAESMTEMLTIMKNELPYVETLFLFRYSSLYNTATPGSMENTFGMFYSPSDPGHRGEPKPIAIAVYRFMHGEDADLSPLYWYSSTFGINAGE